MVTWDPAGRGVASYDQGRARFVVRSVHLVSGNSVDPARGVRRLLVALLALALVAAGGAFALSQRGGSPASARATPRPSLFPASFSQSGFLTGAATLVKSY